MVNYLLIDTFTNDYSLFTIHYSLLPKGLQPTIQPLNKLVSIRRIVFGPGKSYLIRTDNSVLRLGSSAEILCLEGGPFISYRNDRLSGAIRQLFDCLLGQGKILSFIHIKGDHNKIVSEHAINGSIGPYFIFHSAAVHTGPSGKIDEHRFILFFSQFKSQLVIIMDRFK